VGDTARDNNLDTAAQQQTGQGTEKERSIQSIFQKVSYPAESSTSTPQTLFIHPQIQHYT